MTARLKGALGLGLVAALSVVGGVRTGAVAAGVADATTLLPKPFKVETVVRGDLDKDGDPDVAILGVDGPLDPDTTNDTTDGDRILLVARNDGGKFTKVGSSKTAVLCRACGGAFFGIGAPPVVLSVEKGVLVVKQSSGSRVVTDWTHRYRIESGKVRLIGVDVTENDRGTAETVTRSTNLLTGVTITTTFSDADNAGAPVSKTSKGKARTVLLEAVELS